ncbi:site-specific integrase [Enterobacter hormaechei]
MKVRNKQSIRNESYLATADGYSFSVDDDYWILDRNYQVNTKSVKDVIHENLREGYLKTLLYFATNMSAVYTTSLSGNFLKFIKSENCSYIDKAIIINFKNKYKDNGYFLSRIKVFFQKWCDLGYEGISHEALEIINGWVLPKVVNGDVVKRRDPEQGPLTDLELQSFNDAAIRAFEKKTISLFMLAMALLISHTGRRPLQILHMKTKDIMKVKDNTGEDYYLINIPRVKQREGFRSSFRSFRITKELYDLICLQAKNSMTILSSFIGRELTIEETKDTPVFICEHSLITNDISVGLDRILKTDILHPYLGTLTKTIKEIVDKEKVISARTGKILHVNSRRFRYTIGTRAAKEGYGEVIIAELLDHSTTTNVGVYVQNNADNAYKIDLAMGEALADISDAFKGQVKRKEEIEYEITPSVKIKSHDGEDTGSCQHCSSCSAGVPIPCYTCMNFTPWLTGPHEKVYQHLISERERIYSITKDRNVTQSLDRTTLAVNQVIKKCADIRKIEQGMK